MQAILTAEILNKELEFGKMVKQKELENSEIIKKLNYENKELLDKNNALSSDIAELQNAHAEYSVLTHRMKEDMLANEDIIRCVKNNCCNYLTTG